MRHRRWDALYCLCIELNLGFPSSPVRPAPVIVSVMSDDHFLCFLLWWWQSGAAAVGPFIPRPVSPPQVYSEHTTVIWTVCTVYTGWSPPCCPAARPAASRRARPHTSPSRSPCGAAVGWAGLSTQNIQTIPNIVTQSGSASSTHRYVNVLCHCQLWLNPSRVRVIATACHWCCNCAASSTCIHWVR